MEVLSFAVLTQSELLDEPSVIVADIGGWTVDIMRLDNRIPNAASVRRHSPGGTGKPL